MKGINDNYYLQNTIQPHTIATVNLLAVQQTLWEQPALTIILKLS